MLNFQKWISDFKSAFKKKSRPGLKETILIADDDKQTLRLLRWVLEEAGFEVLSASNEKEAKWMAMAKKPDLMILDIMFGKQDGTETYEDLLQKGFSRKTPVIFLTALASGITASRPEVQDKYILIGKPFDGKDIVVIVKQLLATGNLSKQRSVSRFQN
jgi:DNA-binding response OmpR family regulator